MIDPVRCSVLALACFLAGCSSAGGSYVQGDPRGGEVDRGETDGRRFDFISNKPEQDDWQIRITGSAMWVSYAHDQSADKLGSINLTAGETRKVWNLIDALDIPNRKNGKKDEDEGYVSLQLKEPGDSGGNVRRVYLSRATRNKDLIALATYLQDLTEKYKKERPHF
jgi:hypothetical protein